MIALAELDIVLFEELESEYDWVKCVKEQLELEGKLRVLEMYLHEGTKRLNFKGCDMIVSKEKQTWKRGM